MINRLCEVLMIVGWLLIRYGSGEMVDNGGTLLGIAGRGFVLIASDTRLKDQYSVKSRRISRIVEVEKELALFGSGSFADFTELSHRLSLYARDYKFKSNKALNIRSLSHLVSNELYSRRFTSPYSTFCGVAGIDTSGIIRFHSCTLLRHH